MLEDILKKLTFSDFKKHISNFLQLFTHPIESWRRAINYQNSSFDFVLWHIIYYNLILFIYFKDIYIVLSAIIFEILITFIPFLLFLPIFKFTTYLSKSKIKSNRLFRLFLIIKLQFIYILLPIIIIAKWGKSDDLFILIDNIKNLLIISFILIYPILLKINLWKKVLTILLNYLSFIFFVAIFGFIDSTNSDLKNLIEKLIVSPNFEYLTFKIKSNYLINTFDDKKILLIGNINNQNSTIYFSKGSFVNTELKINYYTSAINSLSHKNVQDKNNELTKFKLDSISSELKKIVENEIILVDSSLKSSEFESNKQFFKSYSIYLKSYLTNFKSSKNIVRLLKNSKKGIIVKLDNNQYVVMFDIKFTPYNEFKKTYNQFRNNLDRREKYSNVLLQIFIYPIDLFEEKYKQLLL